MNATPGSVPDVVVVYDGVSAALQNMVAGVRPEQWSAPTPCTEWNVRMLVNHVVTGTQYFVANIRGDAPPDRTVDHLGDDPAAAFAAAAQSLHHVFVQPGVMEGVYPSPMGEASGRSLVQMRITEQLVHGWDLGQATGQTLDVSPELAERTLAGLRHFLPGGQRQGGPFADEQECPDEAPPLDRLAAFLGRPVAAVG
jgi:uncharacterized protein (TIGR03086 family)